jgi:hypothetical protein
MCMNRGRDEKSNKYEEVFNIGSRCIMRSKQLRIL